MGAGPTGLALAIWLARFGVRFRVVDKRHEVAPESRALGVHARTLEFYRQLGFAKDVVDGGVVVPSINLWTRGRRVVSVPFRNVGQGLTPFPFVMDFAQDEHERLLVAQLARLGVTVERDTELTTFVEETGGVRATLRGADGTVESCRCDYIAGCDGAHSAVRSTLGIQFGGGTYEHLFYVADVVARGQAVDDGIHVDLDTSDLLALFDMKGAGHVRLVGMVRSDVRPGDEHSVTFGDVGRTPIEHMRLDVERVNWFSTYRVHHRVATRFRVGRAFLLGDAAHVHSPVGAQGMNTGIGDATNLGWKLATVLRGEGDDALLESYEIERIAFARRLVATTDRAFATATQAGGLAAFVRTRLFPLAIGLLGRIDVARKWLFRTVSQIAISYHDSPLSEGRAGRVRAGDRLPWVSPARESDEDNFAPLASLRWQVHVYGDAKPDLRDLCSGLRLALHAFQWRPAMRRAGLARNATYLVRPDGYVAVADPSGSAERLRAYVSQRRLEF